MQRAACTWSAVQDDGGWMVCTHVPFALVCLHRGCGCWSVDVVAVEEWRWSRSDVLFGRGVAVRSSGKSGVGCRCHPIYRRLQRGDPARDEPSAVPFSDALFAGTVSHLTRARHALCFLVRAEML